MADWPADGDTNWNAAMLAFLAVSFNTDGTPKSSVFGLSAYTNLDSDGNAMLMDHAYKAATDGTVYALRTVLDAGQSINLFVGTTNDPVGVGTKIDVAESGSANIDQAVQGEVAKDEYFEIKSSVAPNYILWKSRGALGKPVDQD